jgi:hypothetical protein
MVLIDSKILQETIDSTKTLVLDLNLNGRLRVPIQRPKFSDPKKFSASEKIVFLIGEQHQGGVYRNINFANSNRTLTELVLRLIDHPKFEIKNFFKEGLAEIKFHPELENINKEDFILNHTHPLVTALHLSKNQIIINNCEAKDLFIEFALMSLLYSSLPGVSKMPEQEVFRIKHLLNYYETNEEIFNIILSKSKLIQEKFKLDNFLKQRQLKTLMLNGIEFFIYNERTEPNQELDNLKYLLQAEIKNLLKARDQKISQNIISSQSGLCALMIGDLHLNNLKTQLENEQIPVISISIFI